MAAPPIKEGRGKGSNCSKHWLNLCWYLHNETKPIRRIRKIKISAIGVGGIDNRRRRRRRGMKISVVGEGGE